MLLYNKIIRKSKSVDLRFEKNKNLEKDIIFKVPKNHKRLRIIKKYPFSQKKLEDLELEKLYSNSKNKIFIVDKSIKNIGFVKDFLKNKKYYILPSIESKVKTIGFLNKFIKDKKIKKSLIIVVGGGLLCNCGAYIAEKTNSDYFLFPTTVLSMSDGALGGKVRVNLVRKNKYFKHYHKTFYEPNAVFLDNRFIKTLPKREKAIGLVEIVKHGLFQSQKLYEFLLKNTSKIYKDDKILRKAILWAADLKRICLEIDAEEKSNGSEIILRAGHNISDKIEENQRLKIPHGFAVSIGIMKQLKEQNNKILLKKAETIFDKFGIPKTIQQLK